MDTSEARRRGGFTLIEVAIALGVLGAVLLVAATLMISTMNTYVKLSSKSDTVKQARHSLEVISRDIRESVKGGIDIESGVEAPLLASVNDAMLLTSPRRYDPILDIDNVYFTDADNFPDPGSIILYYLNTTPEGIPQLIRHQLDYGQDLNLFQEPFTLLPAPGGPYVGANLVIIDSINNVIAINRTTGAIGATPPFKPPRVLMSGSTSLDLVYNGGVNEPIEAKITCQFTDRHGRSATTRLSTQVEPRNT